MREYASSVDGDSYCRRHGVFDFGAVARRLEVRRRKSFKGGFVKSRWEFLRDRKIAGEGVSVRKVERVYRMIEIGSSEKDFSYWI